MVPVRERYAVLTHGCFAEKGPDVNLNTSSAARLFLPVIAGAALLLPLCTTARAQAADSLGGVVMDQAWCLRLQKIVDAAANGFKDLRGEIRATQESGEVGWWYATVTWYGPSKCMIRLGPSPGPEQFIYSCDDEHLRDENALGHRYAYALSHIAGCLGRHGWSREDKGSLGSLKGWTRFLRADFVSVDVTERAVNAHYTLDIEISSPE
jgi:hypothetical protein